MELITEQEWKRKEERKQSKKYSKSYKQYGKSNRNWLIVFFLCFIGGLGGWHRFYVGKIGTGIIWMFTLGGFLIGNLIDFYRILSGDFDDKEGNMVERI